MRSSKYDYFMSITKAVALRSPCLSRQVGCVLVDDHDHILSTGYNGPASKVSHCTVCNRTEPGRNLYECPAVHAEMNALLQCKDVDKVKIIYLTVSPCQICLRMLANTPAHFIRCDAAYTQESFACAYDFWVYKLQRVITIGPGCKEII